MRNSIVVRFFSARLPLLISVISFILSILLLELLLPFLLPKAGLSSLSKLSIQRLLLKIATESEQNKTYGKSKTNIPHPENLHWADDFVLHPYLGYGIDPEVDIDSTKFGFYGSNSVQKKEKDKIIVGLFGGSVALLTFSDGKEELISQLQHIPQYSGKKIELIAATLGGYKQPQQLLALNYLFSLGAQFDVIINLDGFNEAALPYSYNYNTGISPYYPTHWNIYSRRTLNVRSLSLLTQIATMRQQRHSLANFINNNVLEKSQIALLLWLYVDNFHQTRITQLNNLLEAELAKQQADYQVAGPTPIEDKQQFFTTSLNIWKESSIQMARLASTNGARYYHFLQPNQYLPHSKPMTNAEKQVALVTDAKDDSLLKNFYLYKEAVEILYPKMREEGALLRTDHALAFFDLTQIFKERTEPIYVDACCHYSPQGTSLLIHSMVEKINEDLVLYPEQKLN